MRRSPTTEKEEAGYIDIDCFHYDYDGPKGEFPNSKDP
jgi:hypothetical protein